MKHSAKLAILFCVLATAWTAQAADYRITATLQVTDVPAPAETIVVNSATRTWYAVATNTATQITIGDDEGGSATNLFNQIAAYPFSGPVILGFSGTNTITLAGQVNQAMSVTATGWGTVTYSTNTVASMYGVRVPISSEPTAGQQNYVASELVSGIQSYATNWFSATALALTNYLGLSSTQTVTGPKTWTGANTFASIATTGLVNYTTAISSPGAVATAEQFGSGATATNTESLAVGYAAVANGEQSAAIGTTALADMVGSISIGSQAEVTDAGGYGIAIGAESDVVGTNGIAIGHLAYSAHANSIAIGASAQTTTSNQVMIGSSAHTISFGGRVDGPTVTNATYYGTVGLVSSGYWANGGATNLNATNVTLHLTNTLGGNISFPIEDPGDLANGPNAGLGFGGAFVKIQTGPDASFGIAGIAGGRDGRLLVIYNSIAQNMTIYNDSGLDPTPANRIYTLTGSDVATTGVGCATLIYDADVTRWILISLKE